MTEEMSHHEFETWFISDIIFLPGSFFFRSFASMTGTLARCKKILHWKEHWSKNFKNPSFGCRSRNALPVGLERFSRVAKFFGCNVHPLMAKFFLLYRTVEYFPIHLEPLFFLTWVDQTFLSSNKKWKIFHFEMHCEHIFQDKSGKQRWNGPWWKNFPLCQHF